MTYDALGMRVREVRLRRDPKCPVCGVTFLRQGQLASFAVALFWRGDSITVVAVDMGAAKKQTLPPLGGEGVTHDWNYLLAQLHPARRRRVPRLPHLAPRCRRDR